MKLSTKIFLPIILISALLILLNGCFLAPSEEQPAFTFYTVTYNGNDENTEGEVPIDAKLYKEGDLVTVLGNTGPEPLDPEPLVNTGYKFAGWNTAADGDGKPRPVGYVFAMGTSDVILYAMWDASPAFTAEEPPIGGGGAYVAPAVPCVDKLEVDPEFMVLCYDSIGSFTLDAIDDNAIVKSLLGDDTVVYSYTVEGIVTVDGATGEITADKCGTTTIDIEYTDPVCGGDPKTASIDVEVKGALIGLKVTPDTSVDPMVLYYDSSSSDSFTLQAIYTSGGLSGLVSLLGNEGVDYTYDSGIVTVDGDTGTITAVGCGETTIEISYTDSVCDGEPQTASIAVEVQRLVVTSGYSGLTEAAGVRYKDGSTREEDIYLGVFDLGDDDNRVQEYYPDGVSTTWPDGLYEVTFSFDKDKNKITTSINSSYGFKLVEYDFDDLLSPGCPTENWNTLDILVLDRLTTGAIAFNNVMLDSFPLGNFGTFDVPGAPGWPSANWTVTGFDFSQSFTITGDLVVKNWTGSENNKLQIMVGCLP